HRQAQGGDPRELEAGRRRHHRRLRLRRGREEDLSARLESAEALYSDRAAAQGLNGDRIHQDPCERAECGRNPRSALIFWRRLRTPCFTLFCRDRLWAAAAALRAACVPATSPATSAVR